MKISFYLRTAVLFLAFVPCVFSSAYRFNQTIQHIEGEHNARCREFDWDFRDPDIAIHTRNIDAILEDTKRVSKTRRATIQEKQTILSAVMAKELILWPEEIRQPTKWKASIYDKSSVLGNRDYRYKHFEILRLTEDLSRGLVEQILQNKRWDQSSLLNCITYEYDDLFTYSGIQRNVFLGWFEGVYNAHRNGFMNANAAELRAAPIAGGRKIGYDPYAETDFEEEARGQNDGQPFRNGVYGLEMSEEERQEQKAAFEEFERQKEDQKKAPAQAQNEDFGNAHGATEHEHHDDPNIINIPGIQQEEIQAQRYLLEMYNSLRREREQGSNAAGGNVHRPQQQSRNTAQTTAAQNSIPTTPPTQEEQEKSVLNASFNAGVEEALNRITIFPVLDDVEDPADKNPGALSMKIDKLRSAIYAPDDDENDVLASILTHSNNNGKHIVYLAKFHWEVDNYDEFSSAFRGYSDPESIITPATYTDREKKLFRVVYTFMVKTNVEEIVDNKPKMVEKDIIAKLRLSRGI